jgi:lipopolysaccharide export system permease protein
VIKLIDKYLLVEFVKPLIFILAAFTIVFIIVDVFESIDFLLDNEVPAGDVLRIYLYYLPYIIVLTFPVAVLLATVFSLGRLSRNYELVAMRSSGVGLFRIVLPLLFAGAFFSMGMMPLGEVVVPVTNQQKVALEELYSERSKGRSADTRFGLRFFDEEGRLYFAERLNLDKERLFEVTALTLSSWEVTERIDAETAAWDGETWLLENVTIRMFDDGEVSSRTIERTIIPTFRSPPEELARKQLDPEEMGYFDLRNFIRKLSITGADTRNYRVDLALKISFPFINLIVILLGAPLALTARRSGMATGFSFGLIVAFLYYAAIRVGQTYGYEGFLHPAVAAWIPNVVFAAGGVALLFAVRLKA